MKKTTLILSLIFIVLILLLLGMGAKPDQPYPVWTEKTPPTKEVKPPDGFKVTPYEAFELVRQKAWALSLKHIWHLYADSKYYYVHDSFLGSSPSLAKRKGVIIDGQTGKILNR